MCAKRTDVHEGLVRFQVDRLRRTYADFREDPRFAHLACFFFDDVYSTEDKSERDDQFRRLYETFKRRLGAQLTAGVGELVALNQLSNDLDLVMVDMLVRLGYGPELTDAQYEEAYRRCDNYDARVTQIDMLCRCIRYFHAFGQHALIGVALKAVKAAAAVFGGQVVIGFLDRGYHAYRSVTRAEIERFEQAIRSRETERNDRIYQRTGAGRKKAAPRKQER